MSGPEMTFTVHPRPASDDPKAIVDVQPLPLIPKAPPIPVEDNREWDTFLGNLHFLFRYALGRY